MSNTQTLQPEAGWIGFSKSFDLLFFYAAAWFGVLVGFFLVAFPAWVVPFWWLWLLLGDGPHLFSTYSRTYFDKNEWEKHRGLLFGSLLWFTPGVLCWLFAQVTHHKEFLDLYLLFASLWSFHHAIRQHYGILSIYQRHAKSSSQFRIWDSRFLYGSFWVMFILFTLYHPYGRKTLQLPDVLPTSFWWVLYGMAAFLFVSIILYGCLTFWRVLHKKAHWPAIFLFSQLITQSIAFFLIGYFEPLYPTPSDPEQFFLAVTVVSGITHSAQYLGIVWVANRRRYQERTDWVARLSSSFSRFYLFFVLFAFLYIILIAARGISPGWVLFPAASPAGTLFLVIYWGFFFHHYYLDQKIWRPHKDATVRSDLGLS